jgi:nitrite reductase/ring-hydroxylating ferredoxin subunit
MAEEQKAPTMNPPSPPSVSRRFFLLKLGVFLNVIAAGLIGIPLIGYIAGAMRRKAYNAWIPLGDIKSFPSGETRLASYTNPFRVPWDGMTAEIPCWVRHVDGEKFQVFAINCAHLGCPVRWFRESQLFMCPCHGGVYYADGARASGPPPRGLYEYEYELRGDDLWVRGGQIPSLSAGV